tara:strand:- start:650 stop:877 length:228 start_codon:yes stop_codon:yes gene_type:complete
MGITKQLMMEEADKPFVTQTLRDYINRPKLSDVGILNLIASGSYKAYNCDSCNGLMPDPDLSGREVTVCSDCYPD